jgi:hypothetical protein
MMVVLVWLLCSMTEDSRLMWQDGLPVVLVLQDLVTITIHLFNP